MEHLDGTKNQGFGTGAGVFGWSGAAPKQAGSEALLLVTQQQTSAGAGAL